MLQFHRHDRYEPLSTFGRVARARCSKSFDDRAERAFMYDDISWLFPLAHMLAPKKLRALRLIIFFAMWSSLSLGRTWTAQTFASDGQAS